MEADADLMYVAFDAVCHQSHEGKEGGGASGDVDGVEGLSA